MQNNYDDAITMTSACNTISPISCRYDHRCFYFLNGEKVADGLQKNYCQMEHEYTRKLDSDVNPCTSFDYVIIRRPA